MLTCEFCLLGPIDFVSCSRSITPVFLFYNALSSNVMVLGVLEPLVGDYYLGAEPSWMGLVTLLE